VVFLGAIIVGLTAAGFSLVGEVETFILTGAVIIGLLVASNLPVGLNWLAFIAVLAGLFLGMDSMQEALSGSDKVVSLFGSGIGIFILLLGPTAIADHFNEKKWQEIGVRIVGSWVAASSLMVLVLSFSSVSLK
jgi:hydrogenase/urease accessory protein HupE